MSDSATSQSEGAASAAPSPSHGSGLDLVGLTKVFPGGMVAVDDVNLHVDHGEYVVLLGPSGCGKTTTLRMIGGHEFPTSGDIVLDGQSLVDLPPHKRPTTTVFQHFALFPHRSVLSNVEFGLKMHGVGKEERRKLAFEALEVVGLTPLADRKPQGALGGAAATRGAGAGPRHEAEGASARRAARRPRPPAAAEDARRAPQPPASARPHVHPRHAQPGRSALDGGSHRRHERGSDPAGGRPVDDRHEAGNRCRRAVHGRQQHHPGLRRRARRRPARRRGRRARARQRACPRSRACRRRSRRDLHPRGRGDGRHEPVRVPPGHNSAECEIVFVEFLGDLVKLHLLTGGERMLAKVGAQEYPDLRGREGERIRISWKEEDVQLLDA